MDKWQRDWIIANHPKLLQDIECNVLLISFLRSSGSLCESDVQNLKTKMNSLEKNELLLEILVKKTSAYKHLAQSLYKCKQSGALQVLLKGIEGHDPNARLFQFLEIERNEEKILSKNILFQGVVLPLRDLCESIDTATLQNVITDSFDASAFQQFLSNKPIEITINTIKEPLLYYVPRTLSFCRQLDPVIFEKLEGDIFCIEGAELYFLQLSEIMKHVSSSDENFSPGTEIGPILKSVTTSSFGCNLTKALMNSEGHKTELFLDAYDEVSWKDLKHIDNILSYIQNECINIRMWITTRPHRRHELENKFGVLGYNIMPFNDSDKISFFLDYWQKEFGVATTEEIKNFAAKCLDNLKYSMSDDKNDIAGIPLQCKMLADIFAQDAKRGRPRCTEPQIQITSVFEMYQRYIEMKFSLLASENEKNLVNNLHVMLAMKTVFQINFNLDKDCVIENETLYRMGILEASKSGPDKPKFVHMTFAEYFVAEYVVTFMKLPETPTGIHMVDILFGHALGEYDTDGEDRCYVLKHSDSIYDFRYPVVVSFSNFFLSKKYPFGEGSKFLKETLRTSKYYKADTFLDLLAGMIKSNHAHLFNYLLDLFLDFEESSAAAVSSLSPTKSISNSQIRTINEEQKQILMDNLSNHGKLKLIVSTASRYSSLEIVQRACKLVKQLTGKPWHEFEYTENGQNNYASLRASLERGHCQIFEYLLSFNKEEFSNEPLLDWCMEISDENSAEVIADKVQIVKRILQEWPKLLNKPLSHPELEHVPLLTRDAHFELIKCLVEAGASLTPSRKNGKNIAHRTAAYFSAEEYHELVMWAVSRNETKIFKQGDRNGCTPVHLALHLLKSETRELLANECGIDFNDYDGLGKSELGVAIDSRSARE